MNKILFYIILISLGLQGCKYETNQDYVNEASTKEIEVLNLNKSNITELEIVGGCSEYNISKSDDNSLSINAKLEIWKGDDKTREQKLEILDILIDSSEKNKIVIEETVNTKTEENYWKYLRDHKLNGETKIKYFISLPSSVKKIRLYTDNGNIIVNNINAEFDLRTFLGDIRCKSIEPKGNSIFANRYGIFQIDFNTLKSAQSVCAISTNRNIQLLYPKGEHYKEKNIQDITFLKFNEFKNLTLPERIIQMKSLYNEEEDIPNILEDGKSIYIYEKGN